MLATVKIVGNKPLFFHKFNVEVLTNMAKPKSGSSGNNPEEWKVSFFHDDGKLYIPDTYIFATLKNASVHTKIGRGSIQKNWISGVTVETPKIYLGREMFKGWENCEPKDLPTSSNLPVYIDIRMVANPNTKGRNVRYRVALSPGWEAEFVLQIDHSILSKQQVTKVVEDGGKFLGIADGRTLGYGRYDVEYVNFS